MVEEQLHRAVELIVSSFATKAPSPAMVQALTALIDKLNQPQHDRLAKLEIEIQTMRGELDALDSFLRVQTGMSPSGGRIDV